jgi:ABC-type multidrug transport system fused ATPase/permease subunit
MKDKRIKEKPSYSLINNMVYVLGLQWKHSKMLLAFLIALIPLSLGISFCNIYLPKLVVSEVINGETINHMIITIIALGLIITSLNITNKTIETYMYAVTSKFNWAILLLTQKKALHTDYENIEALKYRLLLDKAKQILWMSGYDSTLTSMPKNMSRFITNILGYFLFGAIISFASPWITVLLTITALINYFIVKAIQEYQYRHRNDTSILDKKMWYIANNSGKFENAKDIRLYGMNTWFVNIYKSLKKEKMNWDKKFAKRYFTSNIIDALIIFFRDGFAYAVLIYMVLNGSVRIDEFVLYFGAVGSFAGLVGGIFNGFIGINGASLSVCDLRDYLNYIDKNNKSDGFTIESDNVPYEIELSKVTYRYEGADKDTLSDISIKIKAGEKIAIVGLNGAGKTSLIKNICGLYTPSSGNISINGHDKKEFNIYKYYSMFSVVFQDFNFLPVSIANIISSKTDDYTDRAKAIRCTHLAGLDEKINQLPKGIDSMLDKQLNENGIDLSGGEKQKLLLARAIYKDAPILILDEPTSALDPIAESELYQKYNELTKNKTSIYVSHRLASTRFCNRILYMEDGRIVEDGNHDELIQLNGKYAYLFNIQSQYYREGAIENEGCKK